jgi:outer membrane protein TolC
VFSSLLAQRRFSDANFAIPALNRPDAISNTRTTLSIQQPIFDDRIGLDVGAAALGRDLASAHRETARQDLAFEAARAFVRVLELDAATHAAQAAVDAAESDRDRARARRDVGLATDADVLAVDVHLADVRQQQIAASGDLIVARLQLADAVGLPLTTTFTLVRPAPRSMPGDEAALVTEEALARHPQRREADVQIQLADTARRTARAALLPSIGAQADWELDGETLAAQRSSWVVGVDVRVTLFDGFATRARMAEAAHARARAMAERERVDRRLDVDVRVALVGWTTARAREDAGRAALAQARESQRIVRERYDGGLATIGDVLAAAEAVRAAESRATAAEMDVILQGVALDRALGRL